MHVEFRHAGSARVPVRRSKGDQEATGASPAVRVFGLRSGRAVSNRIALAAKAAGLIGRFLGTFAAGRDGPTSWPRCRPGCR